MSSSHIFDAATLAAVLGHDQLHSEEVGSSEDGDSIVEEDGGASGEDEEGGSDGEEEGNDSDEGYGYGDSDDDDVF